MGPGELRPGGWGCGQCVMHRQECPSTGDKLLNVHLAVLAVLLSLLLLRAWCDSQLWLFSCE